MGKWNLAYRGGSWNEDIPYHCSYRHPDPEPTLRGNGLGLRLVRARVGAAAQELFLEAHGLSPAGLADWVAKLPNGFAPAWVASRTGGKEVRFDAVAVPAAGAPAAKLATWSDADRAAYDELKKTHRLVAEAPFLVGGLYHTADVGVPDGAELGDLVRRLEAGFRQGRGGSEGRARRRRRQGTLAAERPLGHPARRRHGHVLGHPDLAARPGVRVAAGAGREGTRRGGGRVPREGLAAARRQHDPRQSGDDVPRRVPGEPGEGRLGLHAEPGGRGTTRRS